MRTVVGIRTNHFTMAEEQLYSHLSDFLDRADIYFVVDNSSAVDEEFVHQNALFFTAAELDLYVCPDWGWRCGDYAYYALAQAIEADFYILIEPDVWFTKETGSLLFSGLKGLAADFLSHNFRLSNQDWYWRPTMSVYMESVYQCAFPLTRLSRRAISYLRDVRTRISDDFVKNASMPSKLFPNDEAFVASVLGGAGDFECLAFGNVIAGINFSKYSTIFSIPRELCVRSGFVYHSARDFDNFLTRLNGKLKKTSDVAQAVRAFEFAFDSGANLSADFLDRVHDGLDEHSRTLFLAWRNRIVFSEHQCLREGELQNGDAFRFQP